MTNEEKELLNKLASGDFDGTVGDDLPTGMSTVWIEIKKGIPVMYKQGPTRKFFNGKENERIDGTLHILQKWTTDEDKLNFLRKFGWLMKDTDVKEYSSKFKPKKR